MSEMMESPPLGHDVETWIWPLSLAEFRSMHWFQHAFSRERGTSSLGAYADMGPSAPNDDDWFLSLGGSAQVPVFTNGRLVNTASMSLADANKFYRANHTVHVENPECLMPSARALVRTFDLPPSHVSCNLYLSSRDCLTPMHFDATDTFVIQLRGTKVWRIAENSTAPLPLGHTGLVQRPVPPAIRNYAPGEWPTAIPTNTREIVATPGTVLYVPRGFWHATETRSDSISAHIHYGSVCWADLVQDVIHRVLSRQPEWRRNAFGLGHDLDERRRAEIELTPMLSRIAEEIAGLSVSDVIGPVACDGLDIQEGECNALYKRVAQGAIGIESSSRDDIKSVRLTSLTPLLERAVEYEVPTDFANACLWISRRRLSDRFGLDDICNLGLSNKDAEELIATVAAAGIIERVEA